MIANMMAPYSTCYSESTSQIPETYLNMIWVLILARILLGPTVAWLGSLVLVAKALWEPTYSRLLVGDKRVRAVSGGGPAAEHPKPRKKKRAALLPDKAH